jgi:hypothetical protein
LKIQNIQYGKINIDCGEFTFEKEPNWIIK